MPVTTMEVDVERVRARHRAARIDVTALPVPIDGALAIFAWNDTFLAEHGHDVRSAYVELFWMGILGPSSTVLLRRLASGLQHAPAGYRLPVVDTAQSLGFGIPKSRQSQFVRALHRCAVFRAVRFTDRGLEVRRRLPWLNPNQVERLPDSLRALHERIAEQRTLTPVRSNGS
ncbi:MAG: hypothetical protein JST73_02035 [Actinobacteria bacterium]|nr:hypothetical protein [Actinomycetota bacterium]